MLEDEMADNAEVIEETQETETTSPVVEPAVDQTKAFAKRLKESTEKARNDERENIAKSFGYENWKEYLDSQTDNKLLNEGLDPDKIKPMIKDLIYNDPDYLEAMNYKKEKELLEKEIFASNAIKALNDKFGTTFASVNELDEGTVNMWNAGIDLEKAYAANNWSKLQDLAVKKASIIKSTKDHLKDIDGSGSKITTKNVSQEEIRTFKILNPGITDEQIRAFINKK